MHCEGRAQKSSITNIVVSVTASVWELVRAPKDGSCELFGSGHGNSRRTTKIITNLAENARLPAIYPDRSFVELGGLMAYGAELEELYRHVADQIDQILKDAKPGRLPFYQATQFKLTINLSTAKVIGLPYRNRYFCAPTRSFSSDSKCALLAGQRRLQVDLSSHSRSAKAVLEPLRRGRADGLSGRLGVDAHLPCQRVRAAPQAERLALSSNPASTACPSDNHSTFALVLCCVDRDTAADLPQPD
jgi:hypothetical protein